MSEETPQGNQASLLQEMAAMRQTIAALQAQQQPSVAKVEDRATGRMGGYVLSLLAGIMAVTLCWERRADGFYPRQEISPYVIPLVAIAGLGLGVPISSGLIGDAIDKVVKP